MKLFCIVLFFPVTAFTQIVMFYKDVDKITQQMRLPQFECFVIKSTGDTITGSKLKGPSGVGKANSNRIRNSDEIKLDDKVFDRYQVKAMQDQYAYYAVMWIQNILGDNVPHFVKMVCKGKINLYYFGEDYSPAGKKIDVFAFQKGEIDAIKILNKDEIISLLADNAAAKEKFIEYFKPQRTNFNVVYFDFKRLIEVINLYNGQ